MTEYRQLETELASFLLRLIQPGSTNILRTGDINRFEQIIAQLEKLYQLDEFNSAQQKDSNSNLIRHAREFTQHARGTLDDRLSDRGRRYELLRKHGKELIADYRKVSRGHANYAQYKNEDFSAMLAFLLLGNFSVCFLFAIFFANDLKIRLNKISETFEDALHEGKDTDIVSEHMGKDEIGKLNNIVVASVQQIKTYKTEEQIIAENSDTIMISTAHDGQITYVSPNVERLLERNRADFSGQNLSKICTEFGMYSNEMEIDEIRNFDGNLIDKNYAFSVRKTTDSLTISAYDLGEEVNLRNFRNLLSAMLSHDIRLPLTAINVSLDLILRKNELDNSLSLESENKLISIRGTSQRMVSNAQALLDLERFSENKTNPKLMHVSLLELIEEALSATPNLLVSPTPQFDLQFIDTSIRGDFDELAQLIVFSLSWLIEQSGSLITISTAQTNDTVINLSLKSDKTKKREEPLETHSSNYELEDPRLELAHVLAKRNKVQINIDSTSQNSFTLIVTIPVFSE